MENTDKILVYDDACPLCAAYTGAFVKSGLLTNEGRKAFSNASPELLQRINWQRSRNEIPLLDPHTRQVWYGIDALLEILGQKLPFIKTIGTYQPVNWLLKRLYNFISYNRKVIVARKTAPLSIDCTPAFNWFYRILFMLVFMVFNTLALYLVHTHLLQHLSFYNLSAGAVIAVHFILVGINCVLACRLPKQQAAEYLGQINMLALITNLLLIPLMITNAFYFPGKAVNYMYLVLLTVVVMKEYLRRMDYAGILYHHRLIVFINLLCLAAICLSLFVPLLQQA
jgi:predicted DCC family thiol-disulfide oxidoreductase YuxK